MYLKDENLRVEMAKNGYKKVAAFNHKEYTNKLNTVLMSCLNNSYINSI